MSSEKVRAELENMVKSLDAMAQTMRDMETPIIESRRELPKASQQLTRASAQTEAAAHHMLEELETIIAHQDEIGKLSREIIRFILKSRSRERQTVLDKMSRIRDVASVSQNNAFRIVDTLQFQDVASHHIQHASEVLEDIGQHLQHLQTIVSGDDASMPQNHGGFDPGEAGLDPVAGRDQREVDLIVSQAADRE